MAKFNTRKTADLIEKNLVVAGFEVSRDGSSLSSSQYVTACILDADENEVFEQVKIRISDHSLPPSYSRVSGGADYEVGPHDAGCSAWSRVVARICERAGVVASAAVRAQESRRASKQVAAQAERAAETAEESAYSDRMEQRRIWIDAEMDRAGLSGLRGSQRKRARAKFGKKYDELNG